MSLMRLLSAGKTLIGVTESESRYRMGKPGMMPKFGSGRNPFRPRVQKADGQESTAVKPPPSASSRPDDGRKERPASATKPVTNSPGPIPGVEALRKFAPSAPAMVRQQSKESAEQPHPGRMEVSDDAKASASSVFRQRASRATRLMPGGRAALRAMFGNWLDGIKAQIPGRATGQARMATARAENAAMQGELSLDRIKVIRNDLSDTDFEIASREPSPPSRESDASANDLKTAPKAGPAAGVDTGRAGRLSGRLDDLRRPVKAAAGQIPASEPGAGGAMFRPVGAGWFASVQR